MDIFWLFFMLSALQPIIKQKLLEASRKRMIALIERERKSRYPSEKAQEIAKLMTSGTWTHDYPITCDRAQALGLPVNSNIPENVLRLMELYPQPMRRQPSVEYVPVPYRSDRHPAPK